MSSSIYLSPKASSSSSYYPQSFLCFSSPFFNKQASKHFDFNIILLSAINWIASLFCDFSFISYFGFLNCPIYYRHAQQRFTAWRKWSVIGKGGSKWWEGGGLCGRRRGNWHVSPLCIEATDFSCTTFQREFILGYSGKQYEPANGGGWEGKVYSKFFVSYLLCFVILKYCLVSFIFLERFLFMLPLNADFVSQEKVLATISPLNNLAITHNTGREVSLSALFILVSSRGEIRFWDHVSRHNGLRWDMKVS